MDEIIENAAQPPVQDGPIGLGEHGIAPPVLTGDEQKALERANTEQAVKALFEGAAALREIETGLGTGVHVGVAGARSTLNFCIGRLEFQARELSK